MELCIVSDEISPDLDAAVHIGCGWGLRRYELRNVMKQRVPDGMTDSAVRHLLELRETYGIAYTALSPGLFKCPPDRAVMDRHLHERLDRTLELAEALGADTIVVFALDDRTAPRQAELRETAIPHLAEACRKAEAAGIRLAVETEYMSGCETARDAKAIIDAIGSPALYVNWDAANAWIAGEDPCEGYRTIRGRIANVHVKDADTRDWRTCRPFVRLGDGRVGWERLMPLLVQDPTVRRLTIETHVYPLIPHSEAGVRRLQAWLQQCSDGVEPDSGCLGSGLGLGLGNDHLPREELS
jgi:sugar phosphate isomerase/epimerase